MQTRRPRYIQQREADGPLCSLIALVNAKLLFGQRTVRPGSLAWERIAEVGGCIAGPCTNLRAMASDLGLRVRRLPPRWGLNAVRKNAPCVINVNAFDQTIGMRILHMVLVTEARNGWLGLSLVNYLLDGPVFVRRQWGELDLPQAPNRKAWRVRLLDQGEASGAAPWRLEYLT